MKTAFRVSKKKPPSGTASPCVKSILCISLFLVHFCVNQSNRRLCLKYPILTLLLALRVLLVCFPLFHHFVSFIDFRQSPTAATLHVQSSICTGYDTEYVLLPLFEKLVLGVQQY